MADDTPTQYEITVTIEGPRAGADAAREYIESPIKKYATYAPLAVRVLYSTKDTTDDI